MSTTNQAKVVSVKLVKGSIQIKLSNSVKFSQDQYLWESKLFEANAVDVCLLTRDKGGGGTRGDRQRLRARFWRLLLKRVAIPSGKNSRKTESQCRSQYNYISVCSTLRSAVMWKHSRQELRFNLETKLRKLKTYYKPVQLQQLHAPRPKTP